MADGLALSSGSADGCLGPAGTASSAMAPAPAPSIGRRRLQQQQSGNEMTASLDFDFASLLGPPGLTQVSLAATDQPVTGCHISLHVSLRACPPLTPN